ncbi:MAG: hypothetical protein MRK02_02290 [Candidatus Scalindua sp.]|nr:hypothetical protein [Candidatus Scalindua sp.]
MKLWGFLVAIVLFSFITTVFAEPDWSKEFDTTLDMGKTVTHRFSDGNHEWNYDGRSGFSTRFRFSSD